jgi:hypothetical protein
MANPFGGFTEEALEAYQQAIAEAKGTDFSEGGSYDFTQCVRPDGTGFGTKGACKPPNRPGKASKPDTGFFDPKNAKSNRERRGEAGRRQVQAVANVVEKGFRAVDAAARKRIGLPPANFIEEDED